MVESHGPQKMRNPCPVDYSVSQADPINIRTGRRSKTDITRKRKVYGNSGNKGKFRVKATRSSDGQTVVTFSSYNAVPELIDVPGYDVEVSDYSIYSYGTKTIVMRRL